ncbi:MAG TPA: COX15/CtaA family protein [Bryobacteraceae bacterium]|nr:COX15/CtaA family protein [Bryobacteraceae bacterium]
MPAIIASPPKSRPATFTRYAWAVLAWNLFVVLWGAYVRASGSGAGCGNHWPLCNGDVVPRAPRLETIIEFTHRMTSAVSLLATGWLAVWSVLRFPRDHRVRRYALLSVVFLFAEALLGAGLVLFEFVASNASVGRAFYLSLHLVNTQFLLAALALTAWYSREPVPDAVRPSSRVIAALPIAVVVSVTGAIAALGDTLYPVASLAEGMRQDLSTASSFLLRLRVLHPVLAVLAAGYFAYAAMSVLRSKPRPLASQIALAVIVLAVAQLGAGTINITLLAPIWMQLMHLLLADLLWLSLVLLAVEAPQSSQ